MRAAPACTIRVTRFGAWNTAVAGLALTALVLIGAWLANRTPRPQPMHFGAAAWASIVIVVLAWRTCCREPTTLRWDGAVWTLEPCGRPQPLALQRPVEGRLQVALDLGPWLLLAFDPLAAPSPYARRWLPVQRRGLEAEWHALRCAVHAPVPPAANGAATKDR
jgi:hypothetical protein